MKRYFAFALLALAACQSDPKPPLPPGSGVPGPIDHCGPGPQPNGEPCR